MKLGKRDPLKVVVLAFENDCVTVPIHSILPVRALGSVKSSRKYRQIMASVREVGLVEPPVVARAPGQDGTFLLLDGLGRRALRAILDSFVMMRKNCLSLFLLDLRFWLYYLIRFAVSLLGLVDLILNAAGVSLPISNQLAGFVCYCLYAALILWIDYTMRPKVETTYALAYDSLQ